jgi:hypothetical protein
VVLLPPQWRLGLSGAQDQLSAVDAGDIASFLDSPQCRVAELDRFLNSKAIPCHATDALCDQCQQHGLVHSTLSSPSPNIDTSLSLFSTSELERDACEDLIMGAHLRMTQVQQAAQGLTQYW